LSRPPRLRSQALSTSQRFPSKLKLRGLVSCRNRSWDSSLQSLPLAGDRLPLSRQLGFLAVIHRRAETYDLRLFHRRFPRTSTLSRGCLVPSDDYGLPFHMKCLASWLPWVSCRGIASFRQLHLLRSFDPSCESVHDWIGFPLTNRPLLSWVSSPLELSPLTPWILDPPEPEGSNTFPSSGESGLATRRTAAPRAG